MAVCMTGMPCSCHVGECTTAPARPEQPPTERAVAARHGTASRRGKGTREALTLTSYFSCSMSDSPKYDLMGLPAHALALSSGATHAPPLSHTRPQ